MQRNPSQGGVRPPMGQGQFPPQGGNDRRGASPYGQNAPPRPGFGQPPAPFNGGQFNQGAPPNLPGANQQNQAFGAPLINEAASAPAMQGNGAPFGGFQGSEQNY